MLMDEKNDHRRTIKGKPFEEKFHARFEGNKLTTCLNGTLSRKERYGLSFQSLYSFTPSFYYTTVFIHNDICTEENRSGRRKPRRQSDAHG
jgi:hypothetical protein